MRIAWITVVVVWAACQREEVVVHGSRATALDRLHAKLAATQRHRSSLEAPLEYTNAYVDLEFAYGFARLGSAERAHQLAAHAHASLAPVATDPVVATLIAVYDARIAEALANEPAGAQLPADVVARVRALSRRDRYEVDRVRERSTVLAPVEAINALDDWIAHSRGSDVDVTTAPDLELAAAATAVEPVRETLLCAYLDDALGVPAPAAAPIVRRAVELAATMSAEPRAVVAAKALFVAAHAKQGDLVPALIAEVPELRRDSAQQFLEDRSIELAVEGLRRLGKHRELATMLAAIETHVAPADTLARLALAGGWFVAGDDRRALAITEPIAAAPPIDVGAKEIQREHALALAYAYADRDVAERGLETIADAFGRVTDSYGTNQHLTISVIEVVDGLVIGTIGRW